MTQGELLPVEHRSLQQRRLTGSAIAERIYAARWRAANERKAWMNSGYTILEWVLCPDGRRTPPPVRRRDAAVAASLVQWFGTNCGRAFLESCERQIAEATGERNRYEVWRHQQKETRRLAHLQAMHWYAPPEEALQSLSLMKRADAVLEPVRDALTGEEFQRVRRRVAAALMAERYGTFDPEPMQAGPPRAVKVRQ